MTKTTDTQIRLGQAQKKYTRLKAEVDGTAKTEKAYQKAKKDLAYARQAHAETRNTYARVGDATVAVKAVAARTGTNNEKEKS